MTEQAAQPKKREVQKHFLPKGYKSPHATTISQWLTFGGTLPAGEVLHKFEMQVALPEVPEGEAVVYGLTVGDFVQRGAQKLGTEVDNTFKKTLFQGIDSPSKAGEADPKMHLAAQKALDKWTYSPRVGKGKTAAVSDVVASLVAAGVLPEGAVGEITTNEQLQAAVAALQK